MSKLNREEVLFMCFGSEDETELRFEALETLRVVLTDADVSGNADTTSASVVAAISALTAVLSVLSVGCDGSEGLSSGTLPSCGAGTTGTAVTLFVVE